MEFIVNIDLVEFLVELTKKASAKSAEASGDGGIRTLVPRRANAFRVRPVMTASIRLRIICAQSVFMNCNLNFHNI